MKKLTVSWRPRAPIGTEWGSAVQLMQSTSEGYQMEVRIPHGVLLTFGGQNYGTTQAATQQMDNLLVVTPGPGTPVSLTPTLKVSVFPHQSLVTWNQGKWVIQVSAAPGTESLSFLEQRARHLATAIAASSLPSTSLGVIGWSHGSNGQDSVAVSWQAGSRAYFINEPQTGSVAPILHMASAMRRYPANG